MILNDANSGNILSFADDTSLFLSDSELAVYFDDQILRSIIYSTGSVLTNCV